MTEEIVVREIERQLNKERRFFINVHGSTFSKNGTPDFITHSSTGQLVGIEAKVDGKSPVINQWRRCIEMLNSGARYIVAQSDFSVQSMDLNNIPKMSIKGEISEEFDLADVKLKQTTEIVLR